jgi:hypothetical protein
MSNKYYQWTNDFDFPSPDDLFIPDPWKEFDLFGGEEINKKLPYIELIFKNQEQLSDSIPARKILLFFSKELVSFIKDNYRQVPIQAFPIKIKMNDVALPVGDYFLVNVLNVKDVIDKERSKLVMDEGDIINIKHLEIIDEDFENNEFFRLEGFSSLLICSESFVQSLKENGFTGMKFTPISKLFI